MSLFNRTYTFVDGTIAYGSQVEAEIGNIVTVLNNLNTATTAWGQVSVSNAVSVPLISDCAAGSQHIADFKNNSVIKASVSSAGLVTCVGLTTSNGITKSGAAIAAGSQKVTGLAAATANGDALRYEQGFVRQAYVQATSTTNDSTSSTTFTDTSLSASITPTASSSRVKITVTGIGQASAGAAYYTIARSSTDLSNGGGFSQTEVAGKNLAVAMTYIDSPATTSSTTYKVRFKTNSGANTAFFNNSASMVMILEEII